MISVPTDDADVTTREKFMHAIGVPKAASEYPLNPLFDDETIREKFFDAGLTTKQVEKIYSIAEEFLFPTLSEIFSLRHESESIA